MSCISDTIYLLRFTCMMFLILTYPTTLLRDVKFGPVNGRHIRIVIALKTVICTIKDANQNTCANFVIGK